MSQKTVLVLGASGRFGRNAAAAFEAQGWAVRRFQRGRDDLREAATGASVLVQGWNPAYPQWASEVPGQTRTLIDLAEQTGMRVIVPGNVYVYGQGSPEMLRVDTPHAATNPLGRIRIEMEAAWRASSARVTVLRAGDYIDTEASGNWFDKVVIAKAARGVFTYPGAVDRVHAWAFLPDLARAAVELAEQGDQHGRFVDVPFAGYSLTGQEMCAAMSEAIGRPLRLQRMGWTPVRALGLVAPMMRCLVEMRYLWDMPHRLDPGPMDQMLPGFRPTALRQALRAALPEAVSQPMAARVRVPTHWVGHARIV